MKYAIAAEKVQKQPALVVKKKENTKDGIY